jgi:pyruvate ferredoxin oxidoreductase beta subunit
VETGIFPLYEIVDGRYKLSLDFPKLRPIEDYFNLQGRFRHLSESTLLQIQDKVNEDYARLKERAK